MGIENAHVEIYKDGVLVAEGYTDATGRFSYGLTEVGTYLIRISKAGYATIEKTETIAGATELMVNLQPAPHLGETLDFKPELEISAESHSTQELTPALDISVAWS